MAELQGLVKQAFGKFRRKGKRWHVMSGNADGDLGVSGSPGEQYVTVPVAGSNRFAVGVVKGGVNQAGVPVVVEENPHTDTREIVGADIVGVTYTGNSVPGSTTLGKHWYTHDLNGSDPGIIRPWAIDLCRITEGATLGHVTIHPCFYFANGVLKWLESELDVDLTSYYPSSGAKLVWLTLNSSGACQVIDTGLTSYTGLTTPNTTNYVIALAILRRWPSSDWYADFPNFTLVAGAVPSFIYMHAQLPDVHHAAVTLAVDADVLLGLTGQQITLDAQAANTVFAGPATGAAADPTFRTLVVADLPAHNLLSATHGDTTTASCVRGDLLTGQGISPTWGRLAKGTQYQVLLAGADEPGWGAVDLGQATAITGMLPVGNGGTGLTAGTSGGVLYFSATSTLASSGALAQYAVVLGGGAGAAPYTVTGLGTAGQVLTSNGAGANPTWQDIPAGGAHNLLSASHTDTTVATCVRGDLITGQGVSATWTRLPVGAANKILRSDGTDIGWSAGTIVFGGVSTSLTLPNAAITFTGGGASCSVDLPNAAIAFKGGGASCILILPNNNIELMGGGGSCSLTLPNYAITFVGGPATIQFAMAGSYTIKLSSPGELDLGGRLFQLTDYDLAFQVTGANHQLTIPNAGGTGTVALLETANAFTNNNTIASGKFITCLTNGSTGGYKAGSTGDVLLYRDASSALWHTNVTLVSDAALRAASYAAFDGMTSYRWRQVYISSLAHDSSANLTPNANAYGLAIICDLNGYTAIYTLDGSLHSTHEVSDWANVFTPTDVDNMHWVHWDSGALRYVVTNHISSAQSYIVWLMIYEW